MTYAEEAIKVMESQELTCDQSLEGYSDGFTKYLSAYRESSWIGFADWSVVRFVARNERWKVTAWKTLISMVICKSVRKQNKGCGHDPSFTYMLEDGLLSWEQICKKYQTLTRELYGVELDDSDVLIHPLNAIPIISHEADLDTEQDEDNE